MTTAEITNVLRILANMRLQQRKELRARCIAATAVEIEELNEEEMRRVGLASTSEVRHA